MTDTDTSPEAVERYEAARRVDRALNTPSSALKEIRELKGNVEQLSNARDEAERRVTYALNRGDRLLIRAEAAEAERDALKAELVAAHDTLLDASQQTHKDGGRELARLVFEHCAVLRALEQGEG